MNNVATLVDLMESFNFASVSSPDTTKVIDAVLKFIKRAETHLGDTLSNHPTSPTPKTGEPRIIADSSLLDSTVMYKENFMEQNLVGELTKELEEMDFIPMSRNTKSPEISLHGDYPYVFNEATKDLEPLPISKDSTLYKVLDKMNGKLGVNYNSILINRYRNINVHLGWHKDDEVSIDQSVPITTLLIGSSRRFQISDSKTDAEITQLYQRDLINNSILVMKPGLQDSHFHRICAGRKGREDERGLRFSLTFRRLSAPPSPEPVPEQASPPDTPTRTAPDPPPTQPLLETPVTSVKEDTSTAQQVNGSNTANMNSPVRHSNCVNTLVYGSSLTKTLKSDLLSKRGKTFKVFTKSGAHVHDAIKMVKFSLEKREVCPSCVQSIFLVVGGNDVENIKSEEGLKTLMNTYSELFSLINEKFPAVRINVLSLIPRRSRYKHLQRMFYINEFLEDVCSSNSSNLYFIPMFTKFLAYKNLYHNFGQVYLNEKLFCKDRVHFSATGTSVLAKTLIAVANNPRY